MKNKTILRMFEVVFFFSFGFTLMSFLDKFMGNTPLTFGIFIGVLLVFCMAYLEFKEVDK